MASEMRPFTYRELLSRAFTEYGRFGSVFDIPRECFSVPARGAPAIGPAAGPHTQLAQNILCAWLSGARYIELKTVQKLDHLSVDKPCIDAADEGYNTEWSTELTLDQAYDEYLKAWFLLHVWEAFLFPGTEHPRPGFSFTMSVGYDLAGIKSPAMDLFISRMKSSSREPMFDRYVEETRAFIADPAVRGNAGTAEALRSAAGSIRPEICASVTLSTMHGCPPGEIEAICAYLMEEKGLDTLVKLNPTLLGHLRASEILSHFGFGYIPLTPEGFSKDLPYGDAVPMLRRLLKLARGKGRSFGVKLSNTLAAVNARGVLPGGEMYMSGRALYPLTLELAARMAEDFKGELPISFSGGASARNLAVLLEAGIGPVTMATDFLKPGGYARLNRLAQIAADYVDPSRAAPAKAVKAAPAQAARQTSPHAAALRRAVRAAWDDPRLFKEFRGSSPVSADGPLPLWDCFTATCVRSCPIHQDVPGYIRLAGQGRFADALSLILEKNPLPFMTGYLCDHQCMANCARLDWEGAVRIRDVKKVCAETGYDELRAAVTHLGGKRPARGAKAAVIGAGPAGLAAAAFLLREGFEVHVFEREREPGGVVRHLLPGFRVPAHAVEKDVSLIADLGAVFHFGASAGLTVEALRSEGFGSVIVATGAEKVRSIGIEGALSALDFLRQFRADAGSLRPGKRVAVIGAGDTAMDAARAAARCRGVREVRIVYRRSRAEMPASLEEYQGARADGIVFDFMLSPESYSAGRLTCRVMTPGPVDESGRARPVPTNEMRIIPADTVIAAAGAEPDAEALAGLGAAGAQPGVFVIGDAASGAQTIVKAIASARRAADEICARDGDVARAAGEPPREELGHVRARRTGEIPASSPDADDPSVCGTEAARCLACDAVCLKCVEVCPNRANTIVAVPGFHDAVQVVHLDGPCNECGNCATFCPWDGKPYRDKFTVYADEASFSAGVNPGFFAAWKAGRAAGKLRADGHVREFVCDENMSIPAAAADNPARALISAILRERPWLTGGPA